MLCCWGTMDKFEALELSITTESEGRDEVDSSPIEMVLDLTPLFEDYCTCSNFQLSVRS